MAHKLDSIQDFDSLLDFLSDHHLIGYLNYILLMKLAESANDWSINDQFAKYEEQYVKLLSKGSFAKIMSEFKEHSQLSPSAPVGLPLVVFRLDRPWLIRRVINWITASSGWSEAALLEELREDSITYTSPSTVSVQGNLTDPMMLKQLETNVSLPAEGGSTASLEKDNLLRGKETLKAHLRIETKDRLDEANESLSKQHEDYEKLQSTIEDKEEELRKLRMLTSNQADKLKANDTLIAKLLKERSVTITDSKCIQCDYWAKTELPFDEMLTVGKKMGLYSSHSKHELLLEECGLKLSLPAGVVSPMESAVYEAAVQGLWGGEFVFPEGTRLISGVCFVSLSPSQLTKPVTVELMHCADIEEDSQCKYLSFVVAESHQFPFEFKLLPGGTFSTGSQYGRIELQKFSLLAIVLGVVRGVAAGLAVAAISGPVVGIAAAAATGLAVGVAVTTQRAAANGQVQVELYASDTPTTGGTDGTTPNCESHNLPRCQCRAFLFYENIPPDKAVLSVAVLLDNQYCGNLLKKSAPYVRGTQDSSFRFMFSQSNGDERKNALLRLTNFIEKNESINGWTVTPLKPPPPTITEADVIDFCHGHSTQPPYVRVSIQADQTDPGFKDKLKHTLAVKGIITSGSTKDGTEIVIEKSLNEISYGTTASGAGLAGATATCIPKRGKETMLVGTLDITDLQDVLRSLQMAYFSKENWRKLGLALGLFRPTLNTIAANNQRDVEGCLEECLCKWLRKTDGVNQNGGATWTALVDALSEIGETAIAEVLL